jgi:hypothetical protein
VNVRQTAGAALAALLFFSLAPAAVLAGKKGVPARITQARYVALGYDLGDAFLGETAAITNPDILPEERRALQAMHDDLQRWGKYVVVVRPEDAELFIAIRIGRHGSVGGGMIDSGVTNPFGGPGGIRRGGGMGSAEISSSSDMLTVYDASGGRIGAQLWRMQKSGGLVGEPPKLYQQFRADVEKTPVPEPKEPAKKPE